MRSVQQVEDDDAFWSSYLSVYGQQDDTEISIRAKTRTERIHYDETHESGEGIVDAANLNQMIFYVRSMST